MKVATLIVILCTSLSGTSQLLFPESYVLILDSTRRFKGSIAPSVEIKTPKNLYLEINNSADVVYRFGNHAITLANRFELTRDGDNTILSGGYLYARSKTLYDNSFVWEHYAQYHWAEARGLG